MRVAHYGPNKDSQHTLTITMNSKLWDLLLKETGVSPKAGFIFTLVDNIGTLEPNIAGRQFSFKGDDATIYIPESMAPNIRDWPIFGRTTIGKHDIDKPGLIFEMPTNLKPLKILNRTPKATKVAKTEQPVQQLLPLQPLKTPAFHALSSEQEAAIGKLHTIMDDVRAATEEVKKYGLPVNFVMRKGVLKAIVPEGSRTL